MLINIPKLLVESSFCLLVFYGFYFFLLRKETFFQLNRFYLLTTPLLALVIPQLNITLSKAQVNQALEVVYPAIIVSEEIDRFLWSTPIVEEQVVSISLGSIFFYLYLLGTIFMLARLLLHLWRVRQLIFRGKKQHISGTVLIETKAGLPVSSFFNYIFWRGGGKDGEDRLIWEHEMVHIRQRHTMDLLLMEVMVMINWFNPLIYCFKNSLILTHEYIADQEVVKSSKAKLAYAKLLVKHTIDQNNSRLLNTFNSLTKMRLIMLGKTNSKPWRGVKYFLSLPLLMGLGLLFSFNQPTTLTAPVSQPLSEAENYLANLSEKTITLKPKTKSYYQVQWGDLSCDCYNDQFPTLYECSQLTIPLKQFKRLAKKSSGFTLLNNGQAIDFSELEVMSKRMLPLDGYEGQFDYQNTFDNNSIFWEKIEKGDVLKFTFKANKNDVFTFDVTINTRKNAFDYAYHFCFDEEQFAVDMTNDLSVRTVDIIDFMQVMNHPLIIKKNGTVPQAIESLTLVNRGAMREHQINAPGNAFKLADYPAAAEAEPGDRINIEAVTIEGKKLHLAFDIRKNSSWNGERRKLELLWADRVFVAGTNPIYLDAEKIKAWADQPMSFRLNGKELNINSINSASKAFQSSEEYQEPCTTKDYQASFECVKQLLENAEKGNTYYLSNIITDSDHHIFLMVSTKEQKRSFTIIRDTVPEKEKVEKIKQKHLQKQEKVQQKQSVKEEKSKPEKVEKTDKMEKVQKVKPAKDVKLDKTEKKQKVKIEKANKVEKADKVEKLDKIEKIKNKDPIYFLNGEEIKKSEVGDIDPDTIDSIEVLKGETAVTKFGEKAIGGVVIIKLKEE